MTIYIPAEDSFLLSEFLEEMFGKDSKNFQKKILEIGSGSGIQLETLLRCGFPSKNIFAVDINSEAIELLKSKFPSLSIINSDLFSNIPKTKKFDVIIFNPPYLPEDGREPKDSKIATTGGKTGSETINRFLREAKEFLNPEGKIYLIISNLTKGIDFCGFKHKVVKEKKLFFEKIFLLELTLK